MNALPPQVRESGGAGLRDTTRIAAGDPGLWRDILLSNRRHLLDWITGMSEQIYTLRKLLEEDDEQGMHDWLAEASRRRRGM